MDELDRDIEAGAIGAVAGVVATAGMTALMLAAQRAGIMGELPPHDIAHDTVERTPLRDDVGREGRGALGWLFHFGFGAAAGALFAVLRRRVRPSPPDALTGVGFALLVWTISYLGWVPALHFLPPATDDQPGRPPTMIAAHVVFGALLGTIIERARPGDRD
jgi:hypothetical protein